MNNRRVSIIMIVVASVLSAAGVSAQGTKLDPMSFIVVQPANEWRARVFIGAKVQNNGGEIVGDVNDVMFDKTGRVSTVVLGIGGFLGVGEKDVAVPFSALSFAVGTEGQRIIVVPLSKDELKLAPAFKATEKTALDIVEEKALELGKTTSEKAGQLKDLAIKKIDDMKKTDPKTP
jgi:sporulation protein YlmC with PRC-barrel domain